MGWQLGRPHRSRRSGRAGPAVGLGVFKMLVVEIVSAAEMGRRLGVIPRVSSRWVGTLLVPPLGREGEINVAGIAWKR